MKLPSSVRFDIVAVGLLAGVLSFFFGGILLAAHLVTWDIIDLLILASGVASGSMTTNYILAKLGKWRLS